MNKPPPGRRHTLGTVPRTLILSAVLGWLAQSSVSAAEPFDPQTAAFTVAYNGDASSFRDAAAFVLPNAKLSLRITRGPAGRYTLTTRSGVVKPDAPRKWRWQAPAAPGVYDLEFAASRSKGAITLHVFVMVPADRVANGALNGYQIGQYPERPLHWSAVYRPPAGFIEVTRANEDVKVSPHFRLKQFVCKQGPSGQFPKYVVLHQRLPLKLEAVLHQVSSRGFDAQTLAVMSGYRTPSYNQAIGEVPYSMHLWGSAADVFVDTRNTGVMDDLTGDGRIDIQDAKSLYDDVDRMLARRGFAALQGGLGYYPSTSAHPPFVHVDVRGTKARWKG
ncbi:MAG: D-Ala-D-Ala carboxypeptidase family metallohydrolase [Acidobacteriota bacterium]